MARYAKRLGDLCLLAGSPQDAKGHYETAIATGRAVGEHLYVASSHEDLAAAVLLEVAALESGSAAAFLERYDQCEPPFLQLSPDLSPVTWWVHVPLRSPECAAHRVAIACGSLGATRPGTGWVSLPVLIIKQACGTAYSSSRIYWLNV